MRYLTIEPKLFIENRKRFVKQLKPNSVAIFNSNDEMPRKGDTFFPFCQNPDLFYLSGIDQEETILVLYPDSKIDAYKEILFVKKTNEHIAIWEGHKYTQQEATISSGISSVYWLENFESIMKEIMSNVENVYLNTNENVRYSSNVIYNDLRFAKSFKKKYPAHTYYRSAPIMASLRKIKSKLEIELITKACDITDKAFRKILPFIKPGVMEYEIEAEITAEFIRNRATGHAYTPIIASGKNACVLHYVKNNEKCNKGDLLLLDFGAEYANYAADLSRTIPVNGKFSKRQKEVYNACLSVMKQAIKMLVVGANIDDYHAAVCQIMEKELVDLKLFSINDLKKQDPNNKLFRKYFMHGTSHYLGLDVHDLGTKQEKLQEGMLFSCEPGIYILEEQIGIRIENDILISNKGPIDLLKNVPIEIEEIEYLMNK